MWYDDNGDVGDEAGGGNFMREWDGDGVKLCGRGGIGENLQERDGTGKFMGWVRMMALYFTVSPSRSYIIHCCYLVNK